MSKGTNMFSAEWLDMVFEGKNKTYGAYQLRLLSNRRHRVAMYVAFIGFTLAVCAPNLIKAIRPKAKEANLEVTTLVNLSVPEEPKEEQPKEIYIPPPPVRSTIAFTAPVIKPDEEVSPQEEMKTQDELNETDITIGAKDVQGVDTLPPDITDLENEVQQQIVEVEVLSLLQLLKNNLYSQVAMMLFWPLLRRTPTTRKKLSKHRCPVRCLSDL